MNSVKVSLLAVLTLAPFGPAAEEVLHHPAPATTVHVVRNAGETRYYAVPSPGNNYDDLLYDIKIGALDGVFYLGAGLRLSPERGKRLTMPYVRLLDTNGVEFAMLTFTNSMFWSSGGQLDASRRLPPLPTQYFIACGYAFYCDVLYPHMQGGPQETVVDAASGKIVYRGPARNRDTYGVEMNNMSGLMFVGDTFHARLTTHNIPKATNEVDRVDMSYAIFNIESGKLLHDQSDVADVVFRPTQAGNYLLSMRVGPGNEAYWRAVRHLVVLPKMEWTDNPDRLGELVVNDSIACSMSNDLHQIDDGRMDTALGEETVSDRLPGSCLTNIAGMTARTVLFDRGFFGFTLGVGLKLNMPYLIEIAYTEDLPRSFSLVIGNGTYTPAIHTGHTMGQPAPRYFAEQILFPVTRGSQHAQFVVWAGDDEVHNGFYVGVADPGKRADPFSAKPLVLTVTLYQFMSLARLNQRASFPPDAQRHVWVEQDDMLPADNVRFSPHVNAMLYGMNALAPAALFWNGHGDRNNTLMFPTGRYRQPIRKIIGYNEYNTDVDEQPSNHWNYAAEYCAWARQMGLLVFPRFEYGGSDLLATNAHAVGPEGLPYPPGRRGLSRTLIADSIDVCASGVVEDACAVLTDFLKAVDDSDKAMFRHLLLRRRAAFMSTSYSSAALDLFVRETTNRLAATTATARRTEVFENCNDAYRRWYQGKVFAFVAALQKTYQDALPQPTAPCLYYHWGQSGMPFEGLYFRTARVWQDKWSKIRHTPFEGFPLPCIEDARLVAAVPQWTSTEEGLFTDLVPQDTVRPVMPVYGRLASESTNYFGLFGSRLSAVKISPTLEPSAQVFRTGRNALMAGKTFYHAREFSMYEPVMAFCADDPVDIAFDQSHPPCFPFPLYARRFFANFLALPAVPLQRVAQAAEAATLVVKTATYDGALYVAVVNPEFMPVKAKVVVPCGKASSVRPLVGANTELSFFIGPGTVSFEVALDTMELKSFKVMP